MAFTWGDFGKTLQLSSAISFVTFLSGFLPTCTHKLHEFSRQNRAKLNLTQRPHKYVRLLTIAFISYFLRYLLHNWWSISERSFYRKDRPCRRPCPKPASEVHCTGSIYRHKNVFRVGSFLRADHECQQSLSQELCLQSLSHRRLAEATPGSPSDIFSPSTGILAFSGYW